MLIPSCSLLVAGCLLLATGDQQSTATEQPSATKTGRAITGSFETGFDGIWADDDSDLNLDQYLSLTFKPSQHDRVLVRGSLWVHEDLDSDEQKGSVLWDINDTYDSDVRARLLLLHVEVDDVWGDSTLRIGRQRIQEGAAYNRIDGAYFKRYHGPWNWYAFGGVRASIYEDTHEDPILGGGLFYQLTTYTRLAVDAYWGEENRESRDEVRRGPLIEWLGLPFPRRVKRVENNSLVSFGLWHDFTPNLRFSGRFNVVDGHSDAYILNILGHIPSWDLTYELAHRRQLHTVADRVSDLTSFYRIAGEHEEYDNFFGAVHKPLTKNLTLSLEAELHDADEDSPYTANRDFTRCATILTAEELFYGLDATVALEKWDVHKGESGWIVTGELEKQWNEITLTIGADYQRYEDRIVAYDPWPSWLDRLRVALIPGAFVSNTPLVYLLDTRRIETHENIHAIYGKARWAIKDNQDVTAKVMYEEDDGPESPYWRAQVDYEVRF